MVICFLNVFLPILVNILVVVDPIFIMRNRDVISDNQGIWKVVQSMLKIVTFLPSIKNVPSSWQSNCNQDLEGLIVRETVNFSNMHLRICIMLHVLQWMWVSCPLLQRVYSPWLWTVQDLSQNASSFQQFVARGSFRLNISRQCATRVLRNQLGLLQFRLYTPLVVLCYRQEMMQEVGSFNKISMHGKFMVPPTVY